MKHLGGNNTPKTLTQLRKERNSLEAELNKLSGNSRETRLQSSYAQKSKNLTISQIKEKINDIDLLIEQRKESKKPPPKMTTRTPPTKNRNDDQPQDEPESQNEDNKTNRTFNAGKTDPKPAETESTDLFADLGNGAGAFGGTDDKSAYTIPTKKDGPLDFEFPKYTPMFPRMPCEQRFRGSRPFETSVPSSTLGPSDPFSIFSNNTSDSTKNVTFDNTTQQSSNPSILLGTQHALEKELRRVRDDYNHMRTLFENKIKDQNEEIRDLKTKHKSSINSNTFGGAIPKRSNSGDRNRSRAQSLEPEPVYQTPQFDHSTHEPDPYMSAMRTIAQLLKELQLDTRQKSELINHILDSNGKLIQPSSDEARIHVPIPYDTSSQRDIDEIRNLSHTPTGKILYPDNREAQPQRHASFDHELNFDQFDQSKKPRDSYLRRLRLIPAFDGESYKSLRSFLDIAQALNESWINEAEKNELVDTLNLQLRGEARDVIGDLYQTSFDEMKDKLLKYFSYLVNKEVVTSQLENIRQEKK